MTANNVIFGLLPKTGPAMLRSADFLYLNTYFFDFHSVL